MKEEIKLLSETEGFGVSYDRYVLVQLQNDLVANKKIRNVLEIPSYGIKACPSLYSIGFAKSRAKVTVTDAANDTDEKWEYVGVDKHIQVVPQVDYCNTSFKNNSFDMVWNFASFAYEKNVPELLKEMKRISQKYVLLVSCNNSQIGYPWHRVLHKIFNIPWNHGNPKYNYFWNVSNLLTDAGMKIVDWGAIDSPPWPDPVGFRDIRLHKKKAESSLNNIKWEVPFLMYLKNNNFPIWMRVLGIWDKKFQSGFKKLFCSHLFYFLAKK